MFSHKEINQVQSLLLHAAIMIVLAVALAFLSIPSAWAQNQRTFYDGTGRVTGRAATSSNTTTFYNDKGQVTGRATTTTTAGTTFYNNKGQTTGRASR